MMPRSLNARGHAVDAFIRRESDLHEDAMPDLSTTYLGLKLRTPLVSSASPLTQDIDSICHLEDAGASAIVFHSLFEEAAEGAAPPLPALDRYLTLLHDAKEAVSVPVIGSLCATTLKGWIDLATQIEQAGANALELNLYQVPSQKDVSGSTLEDQYVEFVKAAKSAVKIPLRPSSPRFLPA
jgi:dihydroorotate dehydrogenase (fumarate)